MSPEQRITLHPGPAQPVINGLDVTLTGVRRVTFDLPRAGIDLRAPVTVSVTTDGIAELSEEGYDATMAVLLRAAFLGMKHPAAVMKPERSGVILSTASVAGLTIRQEGTFHRDIAS